MSAAGDYARSRAAFLARVDALGLTAVAYRHPQPGPDGAPIDSDVVRIGPADARKVLVIVSGTHGVEAYAGSDAQRACLDDLAGQALPAGTCVLLLHMLNPWGAAWRRRHNEDNVDLNRHFVDRTRPLPGNDAHAALGRDGFFDSLAEPSPAAALAALAAFRQRHGEALYGQAVFQGQYDQADGLGFGGAAPSWAQALIGTIVADHLAAPEVVALIDLHTGLGPFGIGTLICTEPPGSADTALLRSWYDAPFVALLEDRQDLPYALQGDLANGLRQHLPAARILAISLEFGTYDAVRFAELMVHDAWAERQGDPESPEVEAIRCDLVHFFYPRSALWRAMVAGRTRAVMAMALAGLAGLSRGAGRQAHQGVRA